MSPEDFERLIAPVQVSMTRCVWRIVRDETETEDVVQEVLLQVWRQFDRVQAHPNPSAYLLRLSAHRALDHLRRRRARLSTLDRLGEVPREASSDPRQQLSRDEHRRQIVAFLANLPPREAEAIALHALEDLNPDEIATAMGCRPATVRVLISRARQRFREAFPELRTAPAETDTLPDAPELPAES